MGFHLIVNMPGTITTQAYNWHINSPKPKFTDIDFAESIVVLLQADGDELDKIRARFNDVPITKGNICTWRNEMAQFIYDNL